MTDGKADKFAKDQYAIVREAETLMTNQSRQQSELTCKAATTSRRAACVTLVSISVAVLLTILPLASRAQETRRPSRPWPAVGFEQPIRFAQLEELPVAVDDLVPASPPGTPLIAEPPPTATDVHMIPLVGPPAQDIRIIGPPDQLTLVVRDAQLKDVLAAIARSQGLNIIVSQDVVARVSLTLERVSVRDTINAVVAIAGCTWYEDRGIIYVTSISSTATLAPQLQGRQVEVFQLDFASGEDVEAAIKAGMLSPVGKSYVMVSNPDDNRRTHESVVVEDLPVYLDRIRQYVFQVDQPPRQVLIEARVLQVELADEDRHGVNFEKALSLMGNDIRLQSVGFATPAAPQAFFAELNGSSLDALIECLQTTTDAKTLAAPKVMVINGQQARIQVGRQLGYRIVTTTQTSTLESIEFLDVGVVLEVTPRITRDQRVLMKVRPEVSNGSVSASTGLPEEETTEVETNVMLNDGQGIIIGGLIQEIDSDIQGKVPFFGDVKYIGKIFQRRQTVKSRREIIFALLPRVTPYDPAYQCQENEELIRAGTPLLYGPLERVPRPYEPHLPDAVHDPRTLQLPGITE